MHSIKVDFTDDELVESAQSAPTTNFIQTCRDYLYSLVGCHLYRLDNSQKWHVVTVSDNHYTKRPEFKRLCDPLVGARRHYGSFWLGVDQNDLYELSLMDDLCKNCTRSERWKRQWLVSPTNTASIPVDAG